MNFFFCVSFVASVSTKFSVILKWNFFSLCFFFFLFCLWVLMYIMCLTLYIIWSLFCCTAWSENVWFGSVANWLLSKALSKVFIVLRYLLSVESQPPHLYLYILYDYSWEPENYLSQSSLTASISFCQWEAVTWDLQVGKCESCFLLMVTVSTWKQTPRLLITTFPF